MRELYRFFLKFLRNKSGVRRNNVCFKRMKCEFGASFRSF